MSESETNQLDDINYQTQEIFQTNNVTTQEVTLIENSETPKFEEKLIIEEQKPEIFEEKPSLEEKTNILEEFPTKEEKIVDNLPKDSTENQEIKTEEKIEISETPVKLETPKTPSTPVKKPNLKQIFSLQLSILEKEIKDSLLEFSNSRKWVILQYNEKGQLEVGETGDDENVSSFKDKLQDDQICFVVLKRRIDEAVEKILLIFWAGKQISSIQRAKFIQHKTVVNEFLSKIFQLCGEYYPENRDALNEDKIKQKVIGQSGSVLSDESRTPEKTTPESSPLTRFKSKSVLIQSDSPFQRSKTLTPIQIKNLQTETITIKNEEEANQKLKELNNVSSDIDWIKFTYEGKNINNQIIMQNFGQGTAKDLISVLLDTEVSFVVIRAFVARKAQGVTVQQKISLLTWIGNKVKASQRASAGSHGALLKTNISKFFHVAGETKIDNQNDLTNEKIFGNEVLEKQDGLSKIVKPEVKKEEVEVDKNQLEIDQLKLDLSLNWILISDETGMIQDKGSDIENIIEKISGNSYIVYKYIKDNQETPLEKKFEKKEVKLEENIEIKEEKSELNLNIDIPEVEEELDENEKKIENKKKDETPKESPILKEEKKIEKEISFYFISVSFENQISKNKEKVINFITKSLTLNGELFLSKDSLKDSFIKEQIEKKEFKPIEKPKEYVDPRLKSKSFIIKRNLDQDQDLSFKNENDVINTLRDLINDRSETNYIVFGYRNGSMEILSSGKNGIEGMKEFMEPKEIRYVIYKIIGSTSYGGSLKVVVITWIGPEAGIAQKAKSATHRTFIGNYTKRFMALAGEYPLLNIEDLNDEKILQKLNSSVSDLSTKIEISQNRKFGGKDCTLSFVDDKQIDQDYEELKAQDLKIKWLLFAYDKDDLNKLNIIAKGPGGVSSFKPLMKDDQVYYVLMRLTFMEYYDIAKAILITVVGSQVPHFKKALSSGHRYLLYQFSKTKISLAGEYQPDSLEEMTDRDLAAKLTGSSDDNVKEETTSGRQEAPKQIGSKFEIKDVHSFTGKKIEYEFTGKEEMKTQLLILKDSSNNLEYLKFSIEGKDFRDLKFIESGNNALINEWKEKHLKPNETLLFIVSLTFSEVGYGKMTKNAFIQWTGNEIKALRRSKSSEIRHSLFIYVNSILNISTEIQATLPEHLSREILLSRFTGSNLRGKEMEIDEKLEKFKDFGKKKIDLQFENIQTIYEAIDDLVKEESKINWVLVKYCKDSFDRLEFGEKGEGGIDQIKSKLEDNDIGFVALKVMHSFGYVKDMDGMAKPYYGLVQWQGHKVTVLEKAVCSHHFNVFAKTIRKRIEKNQCVVSGGHLHCEKQEEFTIEDLKKTMRLFD